MSVVIGNGDATFQAKTDHASGARRFSVAVQDVNGDRAADVVIVNSGANTLNGAGPAASRSPARRSPRARIRPAGLHGS